MMQFSEFEKNLDIYLRARFTLLIIVTTEEERALQSIFRVCEASRRNCLNWDLAEGFHQMGNSSLPIPNAPDPLDRKSVV